MKTNKQKGFTIIEVLIVLAIGGAIMLVVFLSVPALQRTSRNSQRRNDIGRIGGAVTEVMQNNYGRIPIPSDIPTIKESAGTLTQYDDTALWEVVVYGGSLGTITETNKIRIVTGAKCNTSTAGAVTDSSVSSRQIAVQYATEKGSSSTDGLSACQDI